MKFSFPLLSLLFLLFIWLTAFSKHQNTEIRNDFKKHYDQYQVDGSFVMYNQNERKYIFYNPSQYKQEFTPASTFKICNSLIGLETSVIKDENFVLPWDSISRRSAWDKSHDLKSAFRNSVVWYYQELARRVGGPQMKYWLEKAHYGNADTSGGIDKFWLYGGLRVTPEQQIDFLKNLHGNKLPFSQRSLDIVKQIMIVKDSAGFVLRAKTGWGSQEGKDIGWFVGYVETKGNVYYFANCVQTLSKNTENEELSNLFDKSRREIVYIILKELAIVEIK